MEKKGAFKKGLLLGILVGIAWGLDGVLMGAVGKNQIFNSLDFAISNGIGELSFNFSPLVTAFFHESFCFFWVALVLLFSKQLKHVFYLLFRTKRGLAAAIAALVGSPIGMSAYLLAIKLAGETYASSISVIYPGIGALISWIVLKQRLSIRAIIGILISLTGAFMLGFNPSINVPDTFAKGIIFAIVAVFGWALEGVMIGVAMKYIKGEDDVEASPQQLLCLRYFVSMLAYAIIVLPIIGGYPLAGYIIKTGMVAKYLGIAILGAFTYLCWYKAVDLIGSALGTALNSTAALWTIIFSFLLFKKEITPAMAIWGIVIVLGVFIFAVDFKSLFKSKNKEKVLDEN